MIYSCLESFFSRYTILFRISLRTMEYLEQSSSSAPLLLNLLIAPVPIITLQFYTMRPSSNTYKHSVISRSLQKAKTSAQKKLQPPKPSIISKPPIQVIPKPLPKPIHKVQKPPAISIANSKLKPTNVLKIKMNNLPFHIFDEISVFVISNIVDVLKLSHVCQNWRSHIHGVDGPFLWRQLKEGEKIKSIKEMRKAWEERWVQLISKNFQNHEKLFCRLFDYGSTKQNIPNKLIKKLGLQISLRLNTIQLKNIPFTIKTYNFSSYLTFKIPDISKLHFNFSTPHNMFKDKLEFELVLYSRTFMFKHTINKKYLPQQIYKEAIRQKAFNYYLDKNLVLTFFEGDDNFLYLFMEYSLLEIINGFRNSMKRNKSKLPIPAKSIKIWKQLSETKFQSFVEYFKYQADFELHFSFHNSLKQIFTHCDTKVYPVQYNSKSALFSFKIRDSFPKQPTYKLDNKMGMSENVPNLFLLDLVMKDRDRFLITFSGFIYTRILGAEEKTRLEDYMRFQDAEVISLGYKEESYNFQIIIIDEGSRYYIPSMTLQLRSSIIQEPN